MRTLLTSDSSSVCPASAHLLVPRRRTSAPGAEGPPHSGDSSRKARPPELLLLVVPASSWHGKSIHGQSRTQLTSSFALPPSPRCTDAGLQRPGLGLRFSNLPRKKVLQSLVFFLMMRQSHLAGCLCSASSPAKGDKVQANKIRLGETHTRMCRPRMRYECRPAVQAEDLVQGLRTVTSPRLYK